MKSYVPSADKTRTLEDGRTIQVAAEGVPLPLDEVLDEHIKEARYEYSPKIIDEAINNSLENKARAEEYLSLCLLYRLRGIPPEAR